jgi:hypothetical protein
MLFSGTVKLLVTVLKHCRCLGIALAGHSLLLLAAQLLLGFKDFENAAEKKPYTISITGVNNT